MKKEKMLTLGLILSGILLSACRVEQPVPQPTAEETQLPVEVTRQQVPSTTPKPNEEMAIIMPCKASGEVKRFLLDSQLMSGDLYVSVYFPPCYDPELNDGYPVLYLLHGQMFDDNMWLDLGAGQIADGIINAGEAPPFLMVFPYEEFYYRGAENNTFPLAVMDEVVPFVEGQFNICADRDCRALGGISRGASWAVRLGLEQWDMFASIGAHSLPTFRGDVGNLPYWLENIPEGNVPRIYMDTGRFDPEVKLAYSFEQVLNEKGILHEWHLNEGRHDTDYWTANMREYLLWYASVWEEQE